MMGKNRLEAFSDGVMAIIITIMVLELKVPEEADWKALQPLFPVFISYILSFIYVAIYWNNHHHLLHLVKRVSAGIMWSNFNLLFWLSLIPFATAWMGENHFKPLPVALYAVLLNMCGLAYTILQKTIAAYHTEDVRLKEIMNSQKRKGIASIVIYTIAIPLAYINTLIAGFLFVLGAAMWIIPDKKIEIVMGNES